MDPLTIRSKRREKVNPILVCLLLATNDTTANARMGDGKKEPWFFFLELVRTYRS